MSFKLGYCGCWETAVELALTIVEEPATVVELVFDVLAKPM
jgi:hypothetical protein